MNRIRRIAFDESRTPTKHSLSSITCFCYDRERVLFMFFFPFFFDTAVAQAHDIAKRDESERRGKGVIPRATDDSPGTSGFSMILTLDIFSRALRRLTQSSDVYFVGHDGRRGDSVHDDNAIPRSRGLRAASSSSRAWHRFASRNGA